MQIKGKKSMEYTIRLTPSAEKEKEKLPEKDRLRLSVVFAVLRSNPYLGKKLRWKFAGFYALRSWPYRIVYEVDDTQKMVTIIRIRHRKDSYA